MISEEIKKIVDQFNEQGKMNFLEAATEEQITRLKKKINSNCHQNIRNG